MTNQVEESSEPGVDIEVLTSGFALSTSEDEDFVVIEVLVEGPQGPAGPAGNEIPPFRQDTPAAQWNIPNQGKKREPTVVLDGDDFPVLTDVQYIDQTTILLFPEPVTGTAFF